MASLRGVVVQFADFTASYIVLYIPILLVLVLYYLCHSIFCYIWFDTFNMFQLNKYSGDYIYFLRSTIWMSVNTI